MLKMVDGTGIIGVDMVCPLGGTVSPPQPPNYDNVEMEGMGSLTLQNSLKAPLERVELLGNSVQGENPAPDNPQEIKSAGKWNEEKQKYEIDVKVTGKNLIKTSPILPKRWSNNIDNHVIEYITLKPHTTYTLAMEEDTNYVNDLRVRIFSKNDMTRWLVELLGSSENKKKFTTKDDVECVLCVYHLLDYKGDVKHLQLVEGDISTPYEPYTEQTMQIVLDEPLRGIGEYNDTITKDGVVRKIAPYEVNLNDLRDGGYEKTNTVMFSVKVQNKTVGYASSKPSILCNILPDCALQMSNIYNNDKECIAVGGGIVLFRVNKSRLKDISSFEATKQSFIELMADKKMIVEYALETPVTEPLPESVQQQLQALHSENGTTHVFVDSGEVPCGIKLTYRKEK